MAAQLNHEAEMRHQELKECENVLGVEHPDTLMSVANLAVVLQAQRKYDEAEAMNRRALDGCEKVLGERHPDTLRSVANLALVLQVRGKYNEAEAMNRRALDGCVKVLGERHPATLGNVANLALVLQAQGKYEEAEAMNRYALEGRVKVLGESYPETVMSVANLALVLQAQGKYNEAEAMNRRALDGCEKVLGLEHPETLRNVANLALLLHAQGKCNEAEEMSRRALDGCEKVLGLEHPDTLRNVVNLAFVLHAQRKYNEAEEMSRRALERREKVLGERHPETVMSVANLAVVLRAQGKYYEAEEMHLRALEGRKEHPETLMRVNSLASAHRIATVSFNDDANRPLYPENANDSRSGLVLDRHLEAQGEAILDSGIGSMPDALSKTKEQDDGPGNANDSRSGLLLDRHLEAQGEAILDSGIGSMPDALSNSKAQDDDKRSIRSIVTNASRVLLPLQEEKHLLSAFVGDLRQDIILRGDVEALGRISARLSDLLKTFTLRLETSVNSKTELDAKEFVRQQRDRITYQFRERQMPAETAEDDDMSTRSGDGMSTAEKMALWNLGNMAEHSDFLPVLAPAEQQLDEVQEPLRYQEVRSFLLDGPAYQWLLDNARSSALLTERKGTFLEVVTREMDAKLASMRTSKSQSSQVFQAIFDIDWDLPNFLSGQEYETTMEVAFERAITMTGSSNNAQALTCIDYMCQTWPSSGREVVRALQKALMSPKLSCSCCLADGTELNINLRSPKASVVAHGGQAALTELCEQLAWLGAALRTSPVSFGICLTAPNMVAFKNAHSSSPLPSITIQLGFTVTSYSDHGLSIGVDNTCWHAMFRNPVVVDGFPILARNENEQGLELPLDMMSILAEAQFATRYDTTLVLKGRCTMLVPTGQTERSITWHFIFNEDGTRLPYYAFRERCPGWIGTDKVSTELLEDGSVRNFVGWASNITRHLGAAEMKYGEIDWAGARVCSAGLAVEQKLTISVSKVVGGSVGFGRGTKDKPHFFLHSRYSEQLKDARNMYVVLYDVAARRGWLADGASALLHLLRTQVVREPYGSPDSLFNHPTFNSHEFNHPEIDGGPNAAADILKEDRNMKHIILREFESYSEEKTAVPRVTAVSTVGEHSSNEDNNSPGLKMPDPSEGRNEIYKTTSLRELVSETLNTLHHIYDRQVEIATTHNMKELQSPFKTTLEGYEFMDIVSAEHTLTRRTVSLQSNGAAWAGLTRRVHAITLFGQHFGDIYKLTENVRRLTCENWKTVPQGYEYLAAPISLLKEIKLNSWKKGKVDKDSSEIAEGLLWCPSEDTYKLCGSSCRHTFNRVQQLHSSTRAVMLDRFGLGERDLQKADNFAEINGAILFGNNSDTDAGKLETLRTEVHTEGDQHDSGFGSSLQASSGAYSATESSSGVNAELQPARSSAGSIKTTQYPLDQTGCKRIATKDVPVIIPTPSSVGKFKRLREKLAKMSSSCLKSGDAN